MMESGGVRLRLGLGGKIKGEDQRDKKEGWRKEKGTFGIFKILRKKEKRKPERKVGFQARKP